MLEPEDDLGNRGEHSHSGCHLVRGYVDRNELVTILHAEDDGAGDVVGEPEGIFLDILRIRVNPGFGPAVDIVRLTSTDILCTRSADNLGCCALAIVTELVDRAVVVSLTYLPC